MARIAEIPRDSMSSAQKTVFDEIAGGPRGGVRGPFLPLLNSPVLADKVQKLGQFVRYECSIPWKLRELAILVTAFHWKAQYEWFAHESEAIKAGIERFIFVTSPDKQSITDYFRKNKKLENELRDKNSE